MVFVPAILAHAGKQRLVLQLREPLTDTAARITVPAANVRGEIRDLTAGGRAADSSRSEGVREKARVAGNALDLAVKTAGGNRLQISVTLPEAAFVELFLMDHNGKNLGTLLAARLPGGASPPITVALKENESGGPGILAMRVGKKTLQRLFTQVRE
jgi:hypothetical protein